MFFCLILPKSQSYNLIPGLVLSSTNHDSEFLFQLLDRGRRQKIVKVIVCFFFVVTWRRRKNDRGVCLETMIRLFSRGTIYVVKYCRHPMELIRAIVEMKQP